MKTFIFFFLFITSNVSIAQEKEYKNELVNRRLLGFTVQEAVPFYKLPEGKSYKSTGLTANFHQPFFRSKRIVNLGIDFSPQFWIASAHEVAIEVGLNASVNINFQIKKSSLLSFHASSGFHYFGMHTIKQAHGFLFSDNFFGSYKHSIQAKNGRRYTIGLMAGFRHMSNLHINPPNGGIDNLIVGVCFDRVF